MYADCLQIYAEVTVIELLLNCPYTSRKFSVNFKPVVGRVSPPGSILISMSHGSRDGFYLKNARFACLRYSSPTKINQTLISKLVLNLELRTHCDCLTKQTTLV